MTFHVCAADLGVRRDGTGAVVLRVDESAAGKHLTLVGHYERRPTEGKPLSPTIVCVDVAHLARRFQCLTVWSDLFYVESLREELQKRGLMLRDAPAGATGKVEVWTTCRAEILEGRIAAPRIPALLTQLKQVRSKPTSGGGLAIEQPRRPGTHGDLASAFALAVWAAIRGGGDFGFDSKWDRYVPPMRMSTGARAPGHFSTPVAQLRSDGSLGFGVASGGNDYDGIVEDGDIREDLT
jgi:hypothetical protein